MTEHFSVTAHGYTMELAADWIGSDLLLRLTGGSHPHIGTVTTYCKETKKKEVTRFPSHSGRFHKDDVLADVLLEEMSELLVQNCTITSGVHVDGISQEQIAGAFDMAHTLGTQLANWMKEHPVEAAEPWYKK